MDAFKQRRPVGLRALCDAQMHHGETRGKLKTQKVCKNTYILRNRGKIAKVGGK